MPKLTIDQRTKGKAVAPLLNLYKAEPDFAKELKELRTDHSQIFEQWLTIAIPSWIQMKKTLTQDEFSMTKDFFLTKNQPISSDLADKIEPFFSISDPHLTNQLKAYIEALNKLAYKWQLKAPWAGQALLFDQVLEAMLNKLPKDVKNAEIPVEIIEPLLPSAPLPSLQFEVKAHELMFSGRQEIQNNFDKDLADYEVQLKSMGWQELPSSLDKQAFWWFEHYVHQKTYKKLEEEHIEANRESIKRAVWKFSKLLGIKVR